MAKYPGSENEARVAADALTAIARGVFSACGMSADDALLLAESLVHADLRGVHSHGVLRVPEYAKKLKLGGVNPRGAPRIEHDFGACIRVDGGNNMGQIAGNFAMRAAIERACSNGVGLAAVRGSNHCGAMDYFAMMALPHDMIGLATTNALPSMAPWGGIERILGMNPLAVAVPAAGEDPIVLDIAFAMSAHGKIRVYQQKGFPIPDGWAYDSSGAPTTDPATALAGLIAPIGSPSGGYKGAGLAIVAGVLSSFLSGAAFGAELGSIETGPKPGQDGHFFAAISVAAFQDVAAFKARVDDLVCAIRSGRKAPGFERIYAPGEMEADTARAYRVQGIPLNRQTLADLANTAEEFGVSSESLQFE